MREAELASLQQKKPIVSSDFLEDKVKIINNLKSERESLIKENKKQEKVKYSARKIKESIPDLFEVAPNAVFTKTWTLRNDGKTAWPVGVILVQTSGDNLNGNPVVLENNVGPQDEYDFTVQMQAPDKEGRYTAYYRLTFGDNVRFGHKIWCSILVKKPAEVKHVEA
jgi:next to BRCA1 gene 1 protein